MTRPDPEVNRAVLDGIKGIQQASDMLLQSHISQLDVVSRELQSQISAWRNSWTKGIEAIVESLERSERALAPSARRLGELGWTIPLWASPQFVPRILNEVSPDDIDEAFVQLYTYKRRRHFIQLFKGLEDRDVLSLWIGLLRDCRWAYYRKKYRLTVPPLLLVLDGLISVAGDTWERRRPPEMITRRLVGQSKLYELSIWQSIDGFVQQVFKSWHFSAPRPVIINRHWILHGRDEPEWTQADCLRLFQAIDTLSFIIEFSIRTSRGKDA